MLFAPERSGALALNRRVYIAIRVPGSLAFINSSKHISIAEFSGMIWSL